MAALGLMLPSTRRTLLLLAVPFAAALAWLWWQPPAGGVLGALAARLRAGTSLTANPYDARPAIWEEAWRQVGDRPMLGAGPYGYAATTQQGDNPLNAVAPEHAHSLYLTVAAEQGLVGLTALMALIVCCMSAVRPTRRPRMNQDHKFLVAAPAAGLVALAVQGLVDYPLRNALVSALAWLLLGTLAAGARANRLAAARPRESG
jgi:O-antigen ligase